MTSHHYEAIKSLIWFLGMCLMAALLPEDAPPWASWGLIGLAFWSFLDYRRADRDAREAEFQPKDRQIGP